MAESTKPTGQKGSQCQYHRDVKMIGNTVPPAGKGTVERKPPARGKNRAV